MKKFVILAAFAVMSASAFAQFTYGVRAGLNLATISNAKLLVGEDVVKMKPSLYVGAFGEYKVGDFFGLSADLIYSRQGVSFDAFSFEEEGEEWSIPKSNMRLNYLNLPIMARLYVLEGLSVDLGPQFGILLGAKVWSDGVDDTEDIKDEIQSLDVSFGAGLTYNIGKFLIQGRYNLGLTDCMKDNNGDKKFKNNVIQFGVGYRF